MFKQVFRLTFVTFIWKHYKRLIVSTILLFAFLWFVGYAHSEYLNYASQQEISSVHQSFFFKWGAQIIGVACYLLFHFMMPSRKKIKKGKNKEKASSINEPVPGEPDPFDVIRQKEKLRSRAEMMIDKKNN